EAAPADDGDDRLLGGAGRRASADVEDGEAEGAGRRLACASVVRRSSCRSGRSYPRVGRVRRQAAAGRGLYAGMSAIASRRQAGDASGKGDVAGTEA